MAAPRLVDDRVVERVDVIGADQPQRGVRVDATVQQRLVQLAFGDFRRPAPRPDRFTDPAHRPTRRRSTNSRHAGMILAGLWPSSAMSTKSTRSASSIQGVPHGAEPRLGDRHHHRLVQRQTVPDERDHHREELVDAAVERRIHADMRVAAQSSAAPAPPTGVAAAAPDRRGRAAASVATAGGSSAASSRQGWGSSKRHRIALRIPDPGVRTAQHRAVVTGARTDQPQMAPATLRDEAVSGGHHQLDQRQRRLDQPVVHRGVGDDLVEDALIVGAGEHLIAAGDDVLAGKPLHCLPLSVCRPGLQRTARGAPPRPGRPPVCPKVNRGRSLVAKREPFGRPTGKWSNGQIGVAGLIGDRRA